MTEYEIIGGDGKEYGPYPAEKSPPRKPAETLFQMARD